MKFGRSNAQHWMTMPAKFGDPRSRGCRVLAHSLPLAPLRSCLSQSQKLMIVGIGEVELVILGVDMIFGTKMHSVKHWLAMTSASRKKLLHYWILVSLACDPQMMLSQWKTSPVGHILWLPCHPPPLCYIIFKLNGPKVLLTPQCILVGVARYIPLLTHLLLGWRMTNIILCQSESAASSDSHVQARVKARCAWESQSSPVAWVFWLRSKLQCTGAGAEFAPHSEGDDMRPLRARPHAACRHSHFTLDFWA